MILRLYRYFKRKKQLKESGYHTFWDQYFKRLEDTERIELLDRHVPVSVELYLADWRERTLSTFSYGTLIRLEDFFLLPLDQMLLEVNNKIDLFAEAAQWRLERGS